MQSLFTMTHSVTAKPNIQNTMRHNALNKAGTASQPMAQRIGKNTPQMSFSFEARPQKQAYNPLKEQIKQSVQNIKVAEPLPKIVHSQPQIGQPPMNQECGPFAMAGPSVDTSMWGQQQQMKMSEQPVINNLFQNVEGLAKSGLKFLQKSEDTTAMGAAGAAGASY